MYKDGDYRGLSLEEVILAIHDELRENRAFLQMSLLDPDPDNRPAEDLRIRKIMELAGVMENVLDTLVGDTCGSEAEAGHDGEEIPCREESEGGVDVEYRSHTPGKPDESENIEQDWNMDAVGDEAEDVKKKKDKTKKGKKNKKDNWSVNDEIRVLDVLICICITSIFFTTEGKISSIYDPQKLPSLNKYDSIYTLNYYEFWDADHKCIHLHGRIHLEKVGDVKNAILVSTERMNLEEYARTIESMRTIYSVIEIRPSEFILAPEKHEKSKLYNVLGLRTSKGLYPAKDLQPRPARRLYTELDKIDELDILGMSPYGDDSIIDNINKKKKVRIYIYNKKSNAETEVWKKKLTCDYELFDSEEI